ncbi:MAG: nucleotidyltransferase family protein [Caldilinea sp.]|nr:nucleotidyltransferase family protein [Caldilinea sp.]
MTTLAIVNENSRAIRQIARRHGVRRIRVFGSTVRGDDTSDSDIDFLVEVGPEPSPWFPAGLIRDLQQLLGRRVDIVTERGLSPLLRDRVISEAVPLDEG